MSEHTRFNMQDDARQFHSLFPRWHWVLQKVQNVPCIGMSSHNEVFTSIYVKGMYCVGNKVMVEWWYMISQGLFLLMDIYETHSFY